MWRSDKTASLFRITLEKLTRLVDGSCELIHHRQKYHTYMIGVRPVKRRSLDQQHFVLQQKIENQLLIVGEVVVIAVNLRKHVNRAFGFDAAHTRNGVECGPSGVPLLQKAPAGQDQLIDALIAA